MLVLKVSDIETDVLYKVIVIPQKGGKFSEIDQPTASLQEKKKGVLSERMREILWL